MNKENASKLWKIIQEAGDYLQGQLPDHPNHPKGRNSYAHVAICVKSKFQLSYKDIEDDKFDVIYSCLRCSTKVSSTELSRLPEIKCICGFRVFTKARPPIVKTVKAV